MFPSGILRIVFLGILFLLCFGCTENKDLSKELPYNRSIGKKFILKEDLYIFCDYDSSQLSIAGPHAGIIGLPPLVNEKYFGDDYFGKKNRYLKIKGIVKKGSIFTIKQVIKESNIEDSMIEFVIQFENFFATKEIFDTGSILNWKNYPFDKTLGDPPIFNPELVNPLPSDGIWWK